MGSEEFIRLQFEEYLLALLSCMKYHEELNSFPAVDSPHRNTAQLQNYNIEGDPALDFNSEFLAAWQKTSNYALFSRLTFDALLFSITEPRHPSAGGLTMEDIQRRLSQQVADLHLDERVREGREAFNRHWATGHKKVSTAFNNLWSDLEAMREAQRKRNEEKASQTQSQRTSIDNAASPPPSTEDSVASGAGAPRSRASIDVSQAQASVSAAGQKAGAYFSSWGSWASEKRREWQDKRNASPSSGVAPSPSTPTLPVVNESVEADRGRRNSMQCQSEDSGAGLSRSLSRRKRWSNILLRRDSGEFPRRDDSSTTEDASYPRSPLSHGFPAYESEEKQTSAANDKSTLDAHADADGFTAVPLSPNEGLGVNLHGEKAAHDEPSHSKTVESCPDDSVTALPTKDEEQHPTKHSAQ